MAKTRKETEKKSEDIVLRKTRRTAANTSRPSIVLPTEKSKSKPSSAGTAAKIKAKNKGKNEQPEPKPTKRKTKAIASTSKAAEPNVTSDTDSRNRIRNSNGHGDLQASMKPLTVRMDRLFNSSGSLPKNFVTDIILRDWKKYAKEYASPAKTNTKLKGIEYIPQSLLQMQKAQGVNYAFYPVTTEPGVKVGVMMIEAGDAKKTSVTGQYIQFTVLCGKATLKSSDIREHFGPGAVFSIPPKVKYGIKNKTSEPCYLSFFSYPKNAADPK